MKRGTIMRFIIHNKTLLFLVLLIVVSCSKKQELLQSDLYLTQKTIINPFENGLKTITNYNVKNNKIYIKDSIENTVFVYSLDGNFISKFGKKGKGPGELSYLSSFSILRKNYLLLDTVKRKFIEYNKNYNYVKEYNFPPDINIEYAEFYDYDSFIYSFILQKQYKENTLRDSYSLYKFSLNYQNPEKIFDIYSYSSQPRTYDRFHNKLVWAISTENNRVATCLSGNYSNFNIEIRNLEGEKLNHLDYKFKPIKFSKESINRIKEKYKFVKSHYHINKFGEIPKYYNSVNFMEYDEKGNLWVFSYTDEYFRAVFTIFDKSLKEIGKIFISTHANYFRICDNSLVLIDSRDKDNQRLIVYKINYKDK